MKSLLKIFSFVLLLSLSFLNIVFSNDISADRLINRGLFFEQRGDYEKAENFFSQAFEKDPLNQEAFEGIKRISLILNEEKPNSQDDNISGDLEKKDIFSLFISNYKLFILPGIAVLIGGIFLFYLNKKLPSNKKESSEIDDIF